MDGFEKRMDRRSEAAKNIEIQFFNENSVFSLNKTHTWKINHKSVDRVALL